MAATFTWRVVQLDYSNDADKGVKAVHWDCTAVDGDNSVRAYGQTSHDPDPSGAGYVAYDNLTEATVLGWVYGQVNKDDTEAALQGQLDAIVTPTQLSGTPWSAE